MKTLLRHALVLSLLLSLSLESKAHKLVEYNNNGLFNNVPWTPLQLGVWPGVQLFGKSDTCGLSFFLLAESVETQNYGMQIAPFTMRKGNYGLNMAIISLDGQNYGLQLALFTGGKENNGAAIGVFTYASVNSGMQLGISNTAVSRGNSGFQVGLYNQAESGLQIGLLNYNPNANIKCLPFFNYLKPLKPGDGIPLRDNENTPVYFNSVTKNHDKLVIEAIMRACLKDKDYSVPVPNKEYRQKLELPFGQWREFHLMSPSERTELSRQFNVDGENIDLKYTATGFHLKLKAEPNGTNTYIVKGVGIEFFGYFNFQYKFNFIITDKQIIDQSTRQDFFTDEELKLSTLI